MSEGRQLTLLLVGLLVLVAIGFVGATLFPEECEDLEQVGDLELVLTSASAALPLTGEDGDAVERVADDLGIGNWRGAVALPDDARVTPSEFGFYVVTDTAFTVLRPSFGLASAARGRQGLDVIPAGTSLALRAPGGETGIVNSEYELERCGQLPPEAEVLALDRGIAVLDDGAEVVAVTLSGDELFRAPATAGAHVVGDTVVLGEGELVELRDVRDGEVLDRLADVPVPSPVPWIDAAADQLLLRSDGGVLPLGVGAAAFEPADPVALPLTSGPVHGAVTTPAGIVAYGTVDGRTAALATDRSQRPVAFPPPVSVQDLRASADGHVGIVVEVEGARALLVYGRDIEQ